MALCARSPARPPVAGREQRKSSEQTDRMAGGRVRGVMAAFGDIRLGLRPCGVRACATPPAGSLHRAGLCCGGHDVTAGPPPGRGPPEPRRRGTRGPPGGGKEHVRAGRRARTRLGPIRVSDAWPTRITFFVSLYYHRCHVSPTVVDACTSRTANSRAVRKAAATASNRAIMRPGEGERQSKPFLTIAEVWRVARLMM